MEYVLQSERKFPAGKYDVIICGGGTSGVFAADKRAARKGVKTALVEDCKGYVGGLAAEGGCGLSLLLTTYGRRFLGTEKRESREWSCREK